MSVMVIRVTERWSRPGLLHCVDPKNGVRVGQQPAAVQERAFSAIAAIAAFAPV